MIGGLAGLWEGELPIWTCSFRNEPNQPKDHWDVLVRIEVPMQLPLCWRSTSLPGVELACASGPTRRCLSVGQKYATWSRELGLYGACRRRIRAHSSIGQSPRLITGLFLVQTQVGPLPS